MDLKVWRLPVAALVLTLGLAFLGAELLQGSGWLSRVPPATAALPEPQADVGPERVGVLYRAAFTAWAALVLMIPAFALVWRRHRGAWAAWQAWWCVSYVAFVVHMIWAMGFFFGGDFAQMQTSSRVSAFWPGVILLLWWGVDVLLSFGVRETRIIAVQRVAVHLLALVLMVGGSLVKGETALVQGMGLVLLVVALGFGAAGLMRRQA